MAYAQRSRRPNFKENTPSSYSYAPRQSAQPAQPEKKHSAAQLRHCEKTNKPVISGFYHRYNTFFKFVATPINKGKGASKNPDYDLWTAKLEYGNGIEKLIHCTYNQSKKILIMSPVGVYACPNAQGGGFVAKFKKR